MKIIKALEQLMSKEQYKREHLQCKAKKERPTSPQHAHEHAQNGNLFLTLCHHKPQFITVAILQSFQVYEETESWAAHRTTKN